MHAGTRNVRFWVMSGEPASRVRRCGRGGMHWHGRGGVLEAPNMPPAMLAEGDNIQVGRVREDNRERCRRDDALHFCSGGCLVNAVLS